MLSFLGIKSNLRFAIDEFSKKTSSLSDEQKEVAEATKVALEKFAKAIADVVDGIGD